MSTDIEWTDETWNPVVGCSIASPGCDHCYAAGVAHRGMQEAHRGLTILTDEGPAFNGTVRCLPERLDQPLRWRKPRKVFVNSMSDLFHPEVPDEFVMDVFDVMAQASQHTFQVLTKRPRRMRSWVTHRALDYAAQFDACPTDAMRTSPASQWADRQTIDGLAPNVWLGTSIETDRYAWRADHLRNTPAAIRFLSLEPLLGPLPSLNLTGIDWVIVGGESGAKARPMDPAWVRDIRDRCIAAGVPFFFKQWGEWAPAPWKIFRLNGEPVDEYKARAERMGASHAITTRGLDVEVHEFSHRPWSLERADSASDGWAGIRKASKKVAGRELDGRTWDEMPAAVTA